MSPTNTKLSFCDFPGEIRNQIYDLTLISEKPIDLDAVEKDMVRQSPHSVPQYDPAIAVIMVGNSQISREATTTYFEANDFVLNVPKNREVDIRQEANSKTANLRQELDMMDELELLEEGNIPYPLPSTLTRWAKKVRIHINYSNISCIPTNRGTHNIQIRYLMEAAKILAMNPVLTDLHFQFSEYSTAPLQRTTLIHLIWPFLLFVRGVKNITMTRRRCLPDGEWHKPQGHNVLPSDLEELLLYKCRDGAAPKGDKSSAKENNSTTKDGDSTAEDNPTAEDDNTMTNEDMFAPKVDMSAEQEHKLYLQQMKNIEAKLVKQLDTEYHSGWLTDFKDALEIEKQLGSGGKRMAPKGEIIGKWKGWKASLKQKDECTNV